MAKMRVYDFAKEMKIEAKEIVSMLKGTQYEVKAAASNIEDDGQKYVREHLGGAPKTEKPKAEQPKEQAKPSQPKAEQPKTEQAKPAAEKPAEKSEARPKKKASISAVFNPQNSKQMSGGRRQSYHTNATDRSSRPQENRPSQARPQEARPVQPKPEQAKPVTEAKQPTEKPAEVKTSVTPEQPKAPERQVVNARMVQERIAAQARANGANRQRNNHQGNRPQGDRPQGDRNGGNRYQGNRNNNGRPYNNNGRPGSYGSNGQGGRNGAPNRNGQQGGRRLDQEINSFNKDSVKSAPEEIRTKESRENRDRDNRRNKNQDYDKLGSKKQERYINLEKNGGKKKKPQPQPQPKEEDTIRSISLPEHMTIKELADKMKVQASAIVKKLFLKGQMVTVNQEIKYEDAEEIALEFNCIAEPEVKVDVIAELLKEDEEDESTLVARPPVVCVMGHVDHGKTSLLDAIRNTHVTDREAGGITQHIGAYVVSINGQKITFLDTPGHEAFTAMRMRGAKSTDIAILVVAADDGVMPQTVEAINHAKAAGIEIIVAINKIDKPNANVDRVKQELSEYELIPEDWGGSTIFVPVSAHTHEGIDNLLEMILLTAEVCELKANPNRQARGVIIEAQLDKGRGAVATVLVQKGTLHVGEPIACGSAFGKVRAMIDDKGRRVKEAGPSTPVEILGLSSVPDAGETFVACESEKDARNFAETYISEGKEKLLEETRSRMSLDDLFSQIQSGNVKELDIIVKADVQGSVEAVKQSLVKLSNDEVVVKIIHGGVGAINESDVILASASNAIIIGFNVRPDPTAKVTADNEGVDIRLYKVIYNAIEDVEAAMKGMLDPVFEEKVIGHAEIRQIFKASGVGNIAGSYVLDGTFERGCKVRISREGKQIFEGDLASLKRFKDDVKEVKAGYECGLVFDGFNDIEELDQVEAYKMVEVAR
ncbi:MAG: translation initiation factor IF-2 [Lachnospiraceae bacterium]|nr:translation initiation factor IF-2 [Lachnospiraceae bacterium]